MKTGTFIWMIILTVVVTIAINWQIKINKDLLGLISSQVHLEGQIVEYLKSESILDGYTLPEWEPASEGVGENEPSIVQSI